MKVGLGLEGGGWMMGGASEVDMVCEIEQDLERLCICNAARMVVY